MKCFSPFCMRWTSFVISSKPMTLALQLYTPRSSAVTSVIVRALELPRMLKESLRVHTMAGDGLPSTKHAKVASSPRSTEACCGSDVN